jgi:transcription antitermination protein NusB
MISRRNIRVKVMQTLYSTTTSDGTITREQAVKALENHLDQGRQLFVFLIHFLTETARYAETDSRHRAGKHLPTTGDLNVNTKIAGNELLWRILELPSYQKVIKELKPELLVNTDWVRKLYFELVETEIYKSYVSKDFRDKKEEKSIIEFIFTDLMLPNEDFVAYVEETFVHWDDDSEMMNLLMLNFFNKPHTYNFQHFISDEKMKYGKDLLLAVIDKEEICNEYIKTKLHNWDPERTAQLDMILMRMGICEFLFFETIPPKVTINEYIDLAKEYSTPQSGHFVNGILDSIHKDFVNEDKLHKVSFKKP